MSLPLVGQNFSAAIALGCVEGLLVVDIVDDTVDLLTAP